MPTTDTETMTRILAELAGIRELLEPVSKLARSIQAERVQAKQEEARRDTARRPPNRRP